MTTVAMPLDVPDLAAWWGELRHGGLLLSPAALGGFVAQALPGVPSRQIDVLRTCVTPLLADETPDSEAVTRAMDALLEGYLGLATRWLKEVPPAWGRRAMTGEVVKPRRLWEGEAGEVLPVFVAADLEGRLGLGRGRREAARVVEWLRKVDRPIALLTNGRQWRLIFAGTDFDAFAEWDVAGFFEEGHPGPQLEGLRRLLHRPAALHAAILASRKGQAELSQVLGERVRQAVELLIRSQARSLDAIRHEVAPRDFYVAACRVVMRLVVVLFAEARDLLPRDNPHYHRSYGLEGLRELLGRTGDATRRRHMYGAWPRLLALFQLIHGGSHHPSLSVPAYGGELFAPGDAGSADGLVRALAAMEAPDDVDDQVVSEILDLLGRTRVRVRQGRQNTWVSAPVDFSDLSSEYIGILYEGLLDFELHRVADDPVLFLNLGKQPVLPLSRLEGLDDAALKALVEAVKKSDKIAAEDDGDDEAASEMPEVEDEGDVDVDEPVVTEADDEGDARQATLARARAWGARAVRVGKLVSARDLKDPSKVDAAARSLIARAVLPDEWYLVRWGGTRKGGGTFYTRPQLAVPTVVRTLRPLAYEAPEGADGEWKPRPPDEILALKVCDPAMGSGSFLVAALRFLTTALHASLHVHGRIREHGKRALITLGTGKASRGRLGDETLPVPPDDPQFDERLVAVLKRHVVENCLYGVDLDPLAVELGRLALWVETMDARLPFGFLDHKLKVGNALVGAWLGTFERYPAKAWERLGGDAKHPTAVHFPEGSRTGLLAARREAVLADLAQPEGQRDLFATADGWKAGDVLAEAREALAEMHALPPQAARERAQRYQALMRENAAIQALKQAMDTWCALWFWPSGDLADAPTPSMLAAAAPDATRVRAIADRVRFFHWELEFPDVFPLGTVGGFAALVGNPPWDIRKPKSEEFFTNLDALYLTYGKQAALERQRELFSADPGVEAAWLDYNEAFNAFTNWVRHVGRPFVTFTGYRGQKPTFRVEPSSFPYHLQGSGDLNLFKVFFEQGLALVRPDGYLGLLVPSGLYSDKGTLVLRTHLLDHHRWRWLFAFENRQKIFRIHRSFKFCAVVLQRDGTSGAVQVAFMRQDPDDWARAEAIAAPLDTRRLSTIGKTRAFPEVRDERDLPLLVKILDGAPRLGVAGEERWGLNHAQEFHMSKESNCFTARDVLRAEGLTPDELGRWVREDGEILLPLYQGVMFHQYDPFSKGYVRGSGRKSVWRELAEPVDKTPDPQFTVAVSRFGNKAANISSFKAGFRITSNNTNERTLIFSLLPPMPCNNKIGVLRSTDPLALAEVVGLANSFVLDWVARARVSGTQVDNHIVDDLPMLSTTLNAISRILTINTLRLNATHPAFAREWLHYQARFRPTHAWQSDWALTPSERLRLRAINDALVAHGFGLNAAEFTHILDPDPTNPRGFWRVDRELAVERRLTTVAFAAFQDLQSRGLDAFLAQNGGEGWMLPDFVDVDGEPRPLGVALGPRFLECQQARQFSSSWSACAEHARQLLGDTGYEAFQAGLAQIEPVAPRAVGGQLSLFGDA